MKTRIQYVKSSCTEMLNFLFYFISMTTQIKIEIGKRKKSKNDFEDINNINN